MNDRKWNWLTIGLCSICMLLDSINVVIKLQEGETAIALLWAACAAFMLFVIALYLFVVK